MCRSSTPRTLHGGFRTARHNWWWGAAACLLLSVPVPSLAQSAPASTTTPSATDVNLTADSTRYSRESDTVTAEGNVHLTRGSAHLSANRLEWQRGSGRVAGEGSVLLEDGKHRLKGDRFEWNLGDNSGQVLGGELVLDGSYFLEGKSISRQANGRYLVRRGVFSTCPCAPGETRPWSVAARSLSAIPGKTLVARSLTFRVRDVPVLYVPVFLFPTSGRQSGLLLPSFGNDSRNGMRVVQPFYWTINPSSDLAVAYDYRSKLGSGGQAEYRYMTSARSQGTVRTEGLYDRDAGHSLVLSQWRHATVRSHGWNVHADVSHVNSRDYLRVVGEGAEARTTESLESNLFATRATTASVTTVLLRHTEDLVDPQASPVQHLPRVQAETLDRRLGPLPVWAGVGVDADYLYRSRGGTVTRADLAPHLTLSTPLPGRFLTLSGRAEARTILYSSTPAGDGPAATRTYPLSAALSTRIRGRLLGISHQAVLQVQYRYVPVHLANAARFDALEAITPAREAVLRVGQRLGAIHWRLTAPYDLDGHARGPMRSQVDVPVPAGAVLHVDSLHDPVSATVQRLIADLALKRRWFRVSAGEVYDRGGMAVGTPFWADTVTPLVPSEPRAHMHRGRMEVGPWAGLALSAHGDYDERGQHWAEAGYGFTLLGSCWLLAVEYVEFPDRSMVRFRVGLTGAGGGRDATPAFPHPLFGTPGATPEPASGAGSL